MDTMQRAQAAADLLNRAVLVEVIEEMAADAIAAWKSGSTVEERERAWTEHRAIVTVREKLHGYVEQGQQDISDAEKRERRKSEI